MTQIKKGYPCPPGWGFACEANKPTSEKNLIIKKPNNGSRLENSCERMKKKS